LTGQGRLQQLNANLDRLVTERTHELQRANTELQAARDKADELGRAKDAFLASVSHELRNPLNQVSGYCQLLELTELDQDQLADLKKIKQAGSQLLALINDILDYQKIVMGGITLEPELLEVAELLDEVRDAMKFPAEEQGNDLRVDWSDDVGKIYADKQRLRQVLLNLAGNACKFTQQGSVHIHAQRIPRNDAADEIAFSVADTGRGMTPEEQAKLFTPFTKLSAMQGNRAGTGLGLVISKGFSESMGGSIHLSSEYGKGSTFTVQIPATSPTLAASSSSLETFSSLTGSSRTGKKTFGHERVPPDDSIWRTVEFARVPAPPATGQTVLVIDDEADVREMMTRYLGARGFDVRTAASGIEGLELARMLRPVAITLDAIMPGLDGWAVLAALKADRELADIPVIMVTMVDNHRRGQIMGAAEYIVKPIDWQRLSRVLDRFVTANGNRSLLVVEDDESSREMMRRNLERDGWSVLEAVHGAEALEILAVRTPAAILLDLMMPVMDGFEFLNRQSADARAIPIIVITAKDPTPAEYERLNGRAARVLLKGQYTQEDLLQEIHRWVDGHVQGTTAIPGDKQNA
jgi:CheY-like chemotaxis protein/nitrogen-specific signal transduction histidine kinase